MWIATTIDEMRTRRAAMSGAVALVPTMGALHEGHLSLVRRARELGHNVVVSIFVNPTQFGPSEDFSRYPRPIERDLKMCLAEDVDGVFNPGVEEIYPPTAPACEVNVPAVAAGMEGALRPTHFAGVCRVVAKLFNIVQPHVACFGRKDYQQLCVIRAMVDDLCMPIRIEGCPTIREPDGLAMSSRNVYLSAEQRRHALGLSKALLEAKRLIEEAGETDPRAVESAMRLVARSHHVDVDYAEVRHPLSLAKMDVVEPALTGGVVALIAGRPAPPEAAPEKPAPPVRLLDNMLCGTP